MIAEEEKEDKKIKIFQGKKVRTHWDEDKEKWFMLGIIGRY